MRFDLDPRLLSDVGWAVVVHEDEDPAVVEALAPLIDRRLNVAGNERTKTLDYCDGERWTDWLARHRTAPGNVDPRRIPYYVLLVGSPGLIPLRDSEILKVAGLRVGGTWRRSPDQALPMPIDVCLASRQDR